ncbi:MAG: hypothetical protein VW829_06440 [Deltaproteobacteria bacterium]
MDDPDFDALVQELWEVSRPPQESVAEVHRDYLRSILLNLARGALTRQWTIFSGNSNAYSKGALMRTLGFTSRRRVQSILEFLETRGEVIKITGKKYQKQGQGNLYWATAKLRERLIWFGLQTMATSSFSMPFLRINDPEGPWHHFIWPPDHEDYLEMRTINEFAKGQDWALKSAINLVFKHDALRAGRLHTPFQNLPSRHYKIRINTQINGKPICEVDFNANHLRMLLATSQRDVVGDDDAYAAIADEAKVERNPVKGFFTVAMNCPSFEKAHHAARKTSYKVPHEDCKAVYRAFEAIYPGIQLFSEGINFGVIAQNLEGRILRKVMLKGIQEDIFALPIHDAVAVELDHMSWACDAMREAWEAEMKEIHKGAKAVFSAKIAD